EFRLSLDDRDTNVVSVKVVNADPRDAAFLANFSPSVARLIQFAGPVFNGPLDPAALNAAETLLASQTGGPHRAALARGVYKISKKAVQSGKADTTMRRLYLSLQQEGSSVR